MRTFQVKIKASSYEKLAQIAASVRRPTTWQAEEMLEAAIAAHEVVEADAGDIMPVRTVPRDELPEVTKETKAAKASHG